MSRRNASTTNAGGPAQTGAAGGTAAGSSTPDVATTGAGQNETGGAASGATGGAIDSTGSIVDQARQTTGQVFGQVQQQAATRLDRGKESAVTGLTSVADAVRQMGNSLRGDGGEQDAVTKFAAQYGDRAAEQIERLTNFLRDRDSAQLVGEVEDFARRQPGLFVGGAFVLGLLGARFLKSSAPARLPGTPPDASRALPPAPAPTAGAGGPAGYADANQASAASTSVG